MSTLSRRRLLGTAAGVTGAALASGLLPPSVRKALAAGSPGSSSLRDVKHVVCPTQENRSFDHYFGTMAGVRSFGDPNAITPFHFPSAQLPPRLPGTFNQLQRAQWEATTLPRPQGLGKVARHLLWHGTR